MQRSLETCHRGSHGEPCRSSRKPLTSIHEQIRALIVVPEPIKLVIEPVTFQPIEQSVLQAVNSRASALLKGWKAPVIVMGQREESKGL